MKCIDSIIEENDMFLHFYTDDNEYILVYINAILHCYAAIEKDVTIELPHKYLKHVTKSITQSQLYFAMKYFTINNWKFIIRTDIPEIEDGEPYSCQFILNEASDENSLQTQFGIHNYNQNVEITTFSNHDDEGNLSVFTIRPKYHTEIFRLSSLLYYTVSISLKRRLTAHCLPHMLNTYFAAIPHDIAKLIFHFSLI